ncbi:MAG: hypothetical protein HND27_06000 [Bacteroidetes bacterium]|nr:hypothetical protein [Bacteroidota bacterium]MBV6459918.1 hypothetical protein [Flavobacteriales bacterium]WKZ76435.1 MAG: hypothetical protein QY303_05935 [Vicingaceae bacterium]MCL4816358.1 hypothetical protein [Flavobacteriales bacterium]NOG95314.1 hypothetical protein [Bacteroidota bacterium]
MKGIGSIVLCVYFLFLLAGVNIGKHYCGDTLEKISFFSTPESCCDAEKVPDCCKNESVRISIKDNFNVILNHFSLQPSFSFLAFLYTSNTKANDFTFDLFSESKIIYPPPLLTKKYHSLHILFLSLLI